MADSGNGPSVKEKIPVNNSVRTRNAGINRKANEDNTLNNNKDVNNSMTTTEYCEKLQEWMWQYYSVYVNWHSWMSVFTLSCPPCFPVPSSSSEAQSPSSSRTDVSASDPRTWYNPLAFPVPPHVFPAPPAAGNANQAGDTNVTQSTVPGPVQQPQQQQQQQQPNGNAQQPGREYTIPSPLQRFMAEMVDFIILFFIKATIIISIMHLSGMKDISKFAMHFIVEEIDENASMEELQKMMLVALVYRILVCFYEIICIWGAGGATPGKFLIGLRVVTCDSSVLVQPNRVRVVPASNVSLSASTIRALSKNFSIAFLFPAFVTLLFFQHNRTVYDIVAGTIVVKRRGVR
ncbi:protein FAM8A1b [Alosa sapidissima]|uniref:protein FAM8A1b n=1 Tax=Alosa sapidissima TaxID=34773 RepID=UPI001C08B85D|nr:protein FAM8A1b [Alosa sapidissima]